MTNIWKRGKDYFVIVGDDDAIMSFAINENDLPYRWLPEPDGDTGKIVAPGRLITDHSEIRPGALALLEQDPLITV